MSADYVRRLESQLYSLEIENRSMRAVFEALANTPSGEAGPFGTLRVLGSGACMAANRWVREIAPEFDPHTGWLQIVAEVDRRLITGLWTEAVAQNRSFEAECELATGMHVRIFAAPQAGGEYDLVLVDTSALADLKRQNALAENVLEEAREELRQLAYVASHDLSEPLRMVASYSQLLVRRFSSQIGEDGVDYVGFINGAVDRMKALLQDLVSYSRCLNAPLRTVRFESNASLQWALMNLHDAVRQSGARVEVDGELPACCGDQDRIVQVFQHLIANAVKFRSEELPVVRVAAHQDGDFWRFSVQDNGMGIAPEFHQRIFGLFKRLHGKEIPGTGVGLTIVKRIIEEHGGRIWVESSGAAGQGSTFYFTLPA